MTTFDMIIETLGLLSAMRITAWFLIRVFALVVIGTEPRP